MSIQDKFRDVTSFIAECESAEPGAALKSCMQTEPGISLRYMAYRWIQFVLHLLIMVGAILELHTRTLKTHAGLYYAKSLLYLTNWVLILNAVQSLLGGVSLTMAHRHYSARGGQTTGENDVFGISTKLLTVYRTMYCIALNLAVFMVFGYWGLMGRFPKALSTDDKMMFGFYGFSVVLMLVDLVVVQFPYKMVTGLYTLMILMTYLFTTWLHAYTGSLDAYQKKRPIYPSLDWGKPKTAAEPAVTSLLQLEVVSACVLWWLCQMRRYVVHSMKQAAEQQSATPQNQPPAIETHDQYHDQTSVHAEGEGEPQMEKSKKTKTK